MPEQTAKRSSPTPSGRRTFLAAGVAGVAGVAGLALACLPESRAQASRAARSAVDAGAPPEIVRPDARLVEVFADARWCEGPAWDRRAGALVFSDVRGDRLLRLGPGGRAETLRDPSNFANGNAFDRAGRLVTCEHLGRRIVRQEADGRLTVLVDRHRGRRLNAPNDLVVARDGAIWFTDPTFGLEQPEEGRQGEPEQPGRFVFRLAADGALTVASDTFEQPNGLAFSPDERVLYVSDTGSTSNLEGRREIRAFDVRDGRLSNERLFARVPSGIPDGLKVDADGRVYAATDRGATIWTAAGEPLGHIATPTTCGNLAFGGVDGRRLFLCAGTRVLAIDVKTRGATA